MLLDELLCLRFWGKKGERESHSFFFFGLLCRVPTAWKGAGVFGCSWGSGCQAKSADLASWKAL